MKYKKILFLCSILFFIGTSFVVKHFMTNFDEGDHLAAVYRMQHGQLLYSDIFSHHFPFPYYFTFLFSSFWSNANPVRTISIFRMQLTFLYLVCFAGLFITFSSLKIKKIFSLWILLFSTFYYVYLGHLVLSETFYGLAILGICWICLDLYFSKKHLAGRQFWLFVAFIFLGFWSQPFTLPLLLIVPFLSEQKDKLKNTIQASLVLSIPVILFAITRQLASFLEQAIWFNFAVYPKYYNDPLLDSGTKNTFIEMVRNQIILLTNLSLPFSLFQFILSISAILFLAYLFKTKNYKFALSFALLLFATRFREVKITPGQPFNFGIFPYLAVCSVFVLLPLVTSFFKQKFLTPIFLASLFFSSIYGTVPILKQSSQLDYNYHVFWSPKQNIGDLIQKLTKSDEKILIYPHEVELYYFAKRLPPDRFLYWFPWIDSVPKYRQERILALKNLDIPVIYVGGLAFKEDKDYYAHFFPDLVTGYTQVTYQGKKTSLWLKNTHLDRLKNI